MEDPVAPTRCAVCGHPPGAMNNDRRECSHVDCPHRRNLTAGWGGDMHGDTMPSELLCMYCLRPGHYADDCPKAKAQRPRA